MTNPLYTRSRPDCLSTHWEEGSGLIWMSSETRFYENPRNRYMRFRRRFHLNFVPVSAELRLFADTHYQVHLNGDFLARGPGRSDPKWTLYDVVDPTDLLRQGDNIFAVLVLFQGFGTGSRLSIMQGLLFHLVIKGRNGERLVVLGDSAWKASPAPEFVRPTLRLHGPLGCMEVQDLRLSEPTWRQLDFCDEGWESAGFIKPDLVVTPWYHFVESPLPRRLESERSFLPEALMAECELAPPTVLELGGRRPVPEFRNKIPVPGHVPCRDGVAMVVTLDLGKIEVGLFGFEVEARAGTVIDALFSDSLANGCIPEPKQARVLTSRWILGEGVQSPEVVFNSLAFRYVQLWIWSAAPVAIHRVWSRAICHPLPEVEGFRCSDEGLTRLDEICDHSIRLCFQDGIVDSPSREQQQWMGDARKTAIFNHYRWGDTVLHRQLIEQIGQGMDWMGSMVPRYPSGNHNVSPIPSYSLDWICAFEDYRWFTGDDSLLGNWWPNILLAIRWFSAFENERGLLEDVPHWLYIDLGENASGQRMGTGRILTTLNLQYLAALKRVGEYARRVSDERAEEWFKARAVRLSDAIRQELWNGSTYDDARSGEQLSGVVSEVTAAHALLHLEDAGGARAQSIFETAFCGGPSVVQGSPFAMHSILKALRIHYREDKAIEIIRGRYRRLLESDATATWELWNILEYEDGYPVSHSACHAWGAAPLAFFAGAILGIQPSEPGWEAVRIAPGLADLSWAKGACLTPKGEIRVQWSLTGTRFHLDISVPPGMKGELILPGGEVRPLRSGVFKTSVEAP